MDAPTDVHHRRIHFGGKRFILDWNPRTGICSQCGIRVGRVWRTSMHHAKGYFWIFPWFGMEELCDSCHGKQRPPHAPCQICGKSKSRLWYGSLCRSCWHKDHYQKNKEHILTKAKQWRWTNIEKRLAYEKKYRERKKI